MTMPTDGPQSLAEALAALQGQLPDIKKTESANYGKYAGLANISREILPLLSSLGLSFTCWPDAGTATDGKPTFVLRYVLRHISGEEMSGGYPLPMGGTPQAIGSAITYARRYTLCAVTGLAPDDDDDAAAAQAEFEGLSAAEKRARQAAGRKAAPTTTVSRGKPAGATLSAEQRTKIQASFHDLGIVDRGKRLAAIGTVVGHAVSSTNDLTPAEAHAVIEELERRLDASMRGTTEPAGE